MSYQVGVDLGTTYSAAAVCRPGGPVELVPLGQRARSVPSTVYAGPDGAFLIGEAAERRALSDPGRVVREFKRRIGDPTPVLVGREPVRGRGARRPLPARLLQDVAAPRGRGRPTGWRSPTRPAGDRTSWARCAARWPSTGWARRCCSPSRRPPRWATPTPSGWSRVPRSRSTTWAAAPSTRPWCARPPRAASSCSAPRRASSSWAGWTSTRRCSPTCAPRSVRTGRRSTRPTRRCWPRWPGCAGSARRPRRRCRTTPRC